MSVLSVYRRTGGGYVLSHEPMGVLHPNASDRSLVRMGVVESESLGATLGVQVAHQLAQKSKALVSAKSFDEQTPRGTHA